MSPSRNSKDILIKLFQVTCYIPFITAFLHIAFAIENIIVLGSVIYFPNPTPALRDKMWSYHYNFYNGLGNVTIYAALGWTLLYILVLIIKGGQTTNFALRLGCIGYICVFILLFFIDPFGFIKELMD